MRFAGGPKIANFLSEGNDFGQLSELGIQSRGHMENANHMGEAKVSNAGIDAMGKVHSAVFQGDAIEAEGKAAGEASQAQGMRGLMSGVASGIGNMSFGATSAPAPAPSFGSGSYGIGQSFGFS